MRFVCDSNIRCNGIISDSHSIRKNTCACVFNNCMILASLNEIPSTPFYSGKGGGESDSGKASGIHGWWRSSKSSLRFPSSLLALILYHSRSTLLFLLFPWTQPSASLPLLLLLLLPATTSFGSPPAFARFSRLASELRRVVGYIYVRTTRPLRDCSAIGTRNRYQHRRWGWTSSDASYLLSN